MLPLLIKDGLVTAYVASSVAFIVFASSCIETHASAKDIFPDSSNNHSLGKSLLQFVVCSPYNTVNQLNLTAVKISFLKTWTYLAQENLAF